MVHFGAVVTDAPSPLSTPRTRIQGKPRCDWVNLCARHAGRVVAGSLGLSGLRSPVFTGSTTRKQAASKQASKNKQEQTMLACLFLLGLGRAPSRSRLALNPGMPRARLSHCHHALHPPGTDSCRKAEATTGSWCALGTHWHYKLSWHSRPRSVYIGTH